MCFGGQDQGPLTAAACAASTAKARSPPLAPPLAPLASGLRAWQLGKNGGASPAAAASSRWSFA